MTARMIDRPTLVLNRNWQPVNVSTVSRALTLMWNESARAIDPVDLQTYDWKDWAKREPAEGDPFIQSVRFRLKLPEVVTLTGYDKMPKTVVTFNRRNLFRRDHYTCQYCGIQPGTEELTIDHVLPRSRGGTSRWDNCVLACVACNHRKANRTPQAAGMRLRKQPVQPAWTPRYAAHYLRVKSWSRFVSEAYWNVELDG